MRRPENDPRLIAGDPRTLRALQDLQLPPFEVVTSPQLASALGISPRTTNDWRWMARPGRPPCELRRHYKGRALVYRIDVLMDWALTGGAPRPKQELWSYGADWLEQHRLQRTTCARTTSKMFVWLQEGDVIRLKRRHVWADPLVLYPDDDDSGAT